MKARLLARLQRLEAQPGSRPSLFRYGWLKPLPKDYVGERHVVVVKREPTGSPCFEWCEFEERPGPAPQGTEDPCFNVHLTELEAMRSLNRRLQRIEAVLQPVRRPGTDPSTARQRLAMTRVSTDDLLVLCAMADQGRQKSD